MEVILTVADREANGFVALARWPDIAEAEARRRFAEIDAGITEEMEPNSKTAPYTLILDLMEDDYTCLDNNKRALPLQVAMRLARDPVMDCWQNGYHQTMWPSVSSR